MRPIAVTWLDLLLATVLVVCGVAVWRQADRSVTYLLESAAPERNAFLLSDDVRIRELRAKTAETDLDATRTKWIEARLTHGAEASRYERCIPNLERALLNAEKEAFKVRREALRQFATARFWFDLRKTSFTLLVGVTSAIVVFLIVWFAGSLIMRGLRLKPNWRSAAVVASCVLAPTYGFETAGPVGAVAGAVIALLLFFRS